MRVCRPSALRTAVCDAVQCGAVGEQQPLIEDAPNKIFWLLAGRKGRATAGQRNQLQ